MLHLPFGQTSKLVLLLHHIHTVGTYMNGLYLQNGIQQRKNST